MINVFITAISRLMHRTGHPAHHALLFRTNLWMAWRTRRERRGTFCFGRFATDSAAELLKLLLAGTGLPRVYRTLDRRRRRNRPHALDALAQGAARLFFSHLDAASLPPISRATLYGSRARGDHRDDSDVDIMLVFAGDGPDDDTQVTVCNAMAAAQVRANAALPPGVDVASLCTWADAPDEPGVRFDPNHYRNVLADGVDVTFLYAGQGSDR